MHRELQKRVAAAESYAARLEMELAARMSQERALDDAKRALEEAREAQGHLLGVIDDMVAGNKELRAAVPRIPKSYSAEEWSTLSEQAQRQARS